MEDAIVSVTESKIFGKSASLSGPKRTVLRDVSTESSSGRSPWPFRAQCKELFLNWGNSNPQGHLAMSGEIFGGLI